MSGTAGILIVSVVAGLLVGLAVMALLSDRVSVAQRVGAYIDPVAAVSDPQRSLIERALGNQQADNIRRSPLVERLRIEMEVAEINLPLEQLALITVALTLFIGWLLYTTVKSPLAPFLALCVPFAAKMLIDNRAAKQRRAFMEQLPDNLQVIGGAMRAGQNFVGALRSVVQDAPEPSKREFRRAVLDEAIGVPLPEALGQVTERMRSEDFQHVAVVATLQRETGGNTAEVLDLLAETVRERIEIRRLVRGLTAQGRLSGGVLSLMPVGLLLIISIINPGYVHPMFHTTTGLIALGIGAVMIIAGGLVIRRLVDVEI
jgi:tight adherence protein B